MKTFPPIHSTKQIIHEVSVYIYWKGGDKIIQFFLIFLEWLCIIHWNLIINYSLVCKSGEVHNNELTGFMDSVGHYYYIWMDLKYTWQAATWLNWGSGLENWLGRNFCDPNSGQVYDIQAFSWSTILFSVPWRGSRLKVILTIKSWVLGFWDCPEIYFSKEVKIFSSKRKEI